MNCWIFIFALIALASTTNSEKKIVCYYGSWAVYRPSNGKYDISYIEPQLCTHMVYTFIGITSEGDIKIIDPWNDLPDDGGKDGFEKFNNLRKQSPGTKTLIAIGGWNEGSAKYSEVVADSTKLKRFVENVVGFIQKYHFDGFDLDWEYPNQRGGGPEDRQNFITLLKELRNKFNKYNFILSAAVAASKSSASLSYNISAMSKYVDFINLMAYDLHGAWEGQTGLNAPLYPRKDGSESDLILNVDACVKYWLKSGCPPEKLILGMPFYGRTFTLVDDNQNGLGAPAKGPGTAGPYTAEAGMLGYNEICEFLKQDGWTIFREADRVPYAFKGNQWIGYDDVTSLIEKADYVKSLNLGGAMVWSIDTDDFLGNCDEKKYPLLKTLNAELRGIPTNWTTKVPQPTAHSTQLPTTQSPTTVSPNDICKKPGYVRDKKNCSIFYLCIDDNGTYQIEKFVCPNGLAFDTNTDTCNYKNLVIGCN